jgi:hypothetical protein
MATLILGSGIMLSDILVTDTGLGNDMPFRHILNAKHVVDTVIGPLRQKYPGLIITSFYRSARVNERIGGAAHSAHLTAEAVDIMVPGVDPVAVYGWVRANLDVDYIKAYERHVHITKRND